MKNEYLEHTGIQLLSAIVAEHRRDPRTPARTVGAGLLLIISQEETWICCVLIPT